MLGIIVLAILSGLGHRYSHPARMLAFVTFQPIPDAESLPFHHLVLKLVVCGTSHQTHPSSPHLKHCDFPLNTHLLTILM